MRNGGGGSLVPRHVRGDEWSDTVAVPVRYGQRDETMLRASCAHEHDAPHLAKREGGAPYGLLRCCVLSATLQEQIMTMSCAAMVDRPCRRTPAAWPVGAQAARWFRSGAREPLHAP